MALAVRLDKFLSHMGYGTRNEVKNIIKNGWVTIDGETIKKADFRHGQPGCSRHFESWTVGEQPQSRSYLP